MVTVETTITITTITIIIIMSKVPKNAKVVILLLVPSGVVVQLDTKRKFILYYSSIFSFSKNILSTFPFYIYNTRSLCNACGLRYSRTIARENRKREQAQREQEQRQREQREREERARERAAATVMMQRAIEPFPQYRPSMTPGQQQQQQQHHHHH